MGRGTVFLARTGLEVSLLEGRVEARLFGGGVEMAIGAGVETVGTTKLAGAVAVGGAGGAG